MNVIKPGSAAFLNEEDPYLWLRSLTLRCCSSEFVTVSGEPGDEIGEEVDGESDLEDEDEEGRRYLERIEFVSEDVKGVERVEVVTFSSSSRILSSPPSSHCLNNPLPFLQLDLRANLFNLLDLILQNFCGMANEGNH